MSIKEDLNIFSLLMAKTMAVLQFQHFKVLFIFIEKHTSL